MAPRGFNYNDVGKAVPQILSELTALRAFGADTVRYQLINMTYFTGGYVSPSDYIAWLYTEMDTLNVVIPQLPNGLRVILDLHTAPGQVVNNNELIFSNPECEAAWIQSIQILSTGFKNYPNVLGFDPKNEPVCTGMRAWNRLAPLAYQAIKTCAPDKKTYLMMHTWDSPSKNVGFKFLGNDRIVYQTHMYEPRAIAMQGINNFPISTTLKFTKAQLQTILKPIRDFQTENDCTVLLGEFNCTRYSGCPTIDNELLYIKAIIETANSYRWGWLIHSWREADCWDVEMPQTMPGVLPARDGNNSKCKMIQTFL